MMRPGVLILKDLRRGWRDRQALLTNIALPLLLTGVMGLSFGSGFTGGGGSGISAIPLAIVAEDVPSMVRDWIDEQLSASDLFATTWVDSAQADRKVRRGDVRAAIILPPGLVRDYMSGREVKIGLWKDPNSEFKADIIEQILTRVLRQAQFAEAASLALWPEDYKFDDDPITELLDIVKADGLLSAWRFMTNDVNENRWQSSRNDFSRIMKHQASLSEELESGGVRLSIEDRNSTVAETSDDPRSTNRFDYFLPGLAVFFMLFGVAASMKDLLGERRTRTLQRTLLTPAGATEVILGKWCGAVLSGSAQVLVLFVVGAIVFRVNLGPDPWSLVIVTLLAASTGSAAFLVLAVLCRTEKQQDQISTVLILIMAMLGGSFMPVDAMSPFLQMIGRGTFTWWANSAYSEIVTRNHGLGSIGLNLLIMGGLTVLLTSVSLLIWRLRNKEGVGA